MNLSIELTEEQANAAESLRAKYAEQTMSENLTVEAYFKTVLLGIVDGEANRLFNETADKIKAATKAMSYEDRSALVEELTNRIQPK